MMRSEADWQLFRTFLEVVRDGSLTGAARRLSLAQPTAGRHIDALEEALGFPLFTRTPRGLIATPAALELVPHVEAMAAASAALHRAASGEAVTDRGTVRMTASEIIGTEVLPEILTNFRREHPAIVLELALSNRNIDLLRRDADIAIRMVRPVQAALVARRLGQSSIGLYAHKTYLEQFGTPVTLDDLKHHCVIGFDRDDHAFRAVGSKYPQINRQAFGFRCDSDVAQLAALRAGVGIGGCQVNIARRMPDLVRVLPKAIQLAMEVWLVMHEDAKANRRIRLLFDHIAVGLSDYLRS